MTLVALLVESGELTIAAAGHPPPLLRREGTVEPVGPAGMLLGVAPRQTYGEHRISLQTDDVLLLYTDGVTDTPGPGDRFGADRLERTLATAPDEPKAILEAIERALKDFQAGTAIDDRALLVLRRG